MKTVQVHSSVAVAFGLAPRERRRTSTIRQAMDIVVALVLACGLFALIAFLDGVASPDDISPGTALAATRSPPPATGRSTAT